MPDIVTYLLCGFRPKVAGTATISAPSGKGHELTLTTITPGDAGDVTWTDTRNDGEWRVDLGAADCVVQLTGPDEISWEGVTLALPGAGNFVTYKLKKKAPWAASEVSTRADATPRGNPKDPWPPPRIKKDFDTVWLIKTLDSIKYTAPRDESLGSGGSGSGASAPPTAIGRVKAVPHGDTARTLAGRSLHIGVNRFVSGYPKVPGELRAATNDAKAMHRLAVQEGLDATLLLDEDATRAAVAEVILDASRALSSGDLFVLTFAGHGGTLPDVLGGDPTKLPEGGSNRWVDENGDGHDEAWCLSDGVLLDDRINELMAAFAPGVRVYVVSDSCFSGTILRQLGASRAVMTDAAAPPPEVNASVILLAACDERRTTPEDADHGLFTAALLTVWNKGAFGGSHAEFFKAIHRLREKTTEDRIGPADVAFEAGRPFTIAPGARFTPPLKVHLCWFATPNGTSRCREAALEIFEYLHRPVADNPVQRPGLEIPVEVGRDLRGLLDALDRPTYDRDAEPAVGARLVVVILDRDAYSDEDHRELLARAVRRWTSPLASKRVERLLPIVLDGNWPDELGGVSAMIAGMVVRTRGPDRRWQVPADVAIVAGRLLLGTLAAAEPSRPQVFISHTKHDGRVRAEQLANYMRGSGSARVQVWFDETDVDRGDELVAQLEQEVSHGVVLVVRTDHYFESPWCDLEFLQAKLRQVPMVTLLDGTLGEPSPSPYAGNHPTIVWRDGREAEVTARCVQVWLHGHHFAARARAALTHAELPANAEILSRRPEQFDLTQPSATDADRRLIVYPDPPMTEGASALLRSARPDVRIVTPNSMLGRASMAADPTPPLADCTLAFSLSETTELPALAAAGGGNGLTGAHLEGALYAIVLTTLHAGARIAYGGDFRNANLQGYAARLSDLHRARRRLGPRKQSQLLAFVRRGLRRDGDADVDYWPVTVDSLPETERDQEVDNILWHQAMRAEMTVRSQARVVLGGQSRPRLADDGVGYIGPWPGVLEECWRMAVAGKGLYVIGAFGGFAGVLATMLTTETVPPEFKRSTYAGTRVEELERRVNVARTALRGKVGHDVLMTTADGALLGTDEMAKALIDHWQRFCSGDKNAWPNGLSVQDNRRLMRSTDPTEIAHLVFAGQRRPRPSAPTLSIALYHGDLATAPDVDGYAVTTTPGLKHIGALQSLDLRMSGRLGREAAKGPKGVVAVAVNTDGLAGRQVLVAPLPLSTAAVREQTIQALATQVALEAEEQRLESIAVAPFGTTMGIDPVASVDAILRGIAEVKREHLRSVVVCEIERTRYEKLQLAFEKDPKRRELRAGPGRAVSTGSMFVHATAVQDDAGVMVRAGIFSEDGRGGVVKTVEARWSKHEWTWLHTRPATFATTAKVADMLRTRGFEPLFDVLRTSAERRLLIVADPLASSLPWEFLIVNSDVVPALGAGITRRVALLDDARPPADRASTDARLRVLLVVNPRGDLPEAEEEGVAVRAALRERPDVERPDVEVDVVRGKKATIATVSAHLARGNYDVLHYAGHAQFDPERPEACGLWLADGLFGGADFGDRAPRLVVLGGCESVRLRTGPVPAPVRRAPMPLAEAILRAGVSTMIGTFFPVADLAARQFATEFYSALVAGKPVGAAMVAARRKLRDVNSPDWGNFLLFGEDDLIL